MEESQLLSLVRAITHVVAVILVGTILIFSYLIYMELHRSEPEPAAIAVDYVPLPHSEVVDSVLIGKTLFHNNCAACHNRNMRDDLTGPALGGVTKRWSKYPKADLYHFIRDSQSMIKKKHPQALQVWQEFKPTIMNPFPNLTDEQIAALLLYIENQRDYIVN